MEGDRPNVTSLRGVVAAAHPLAALAGARLLLTGGNAIDAAVATAAALNVVEPYMSGIGGIGFAACYLADEGRVRTLDFTTRVPSQFDPARTRRNGAAASIATPGNLAGWLTLLESYGTKTRAEAFAPAIELARDGFPLTEFNTDFFAFTMERLAGQPAWWEIFTDGGQPYSPGQPFRQPDLARTFEAVVSDGAAHLYAGPLGAAMAAHIQSLGGFVSLDDLAEVAPRWSDPLEADYRGLTVCTVPPPCEGFQMLLGLRILGKVDLTELAPNEAGHLDVVTRAIRLAAEARIRNNNAAPQEIYRLLDDPSVTQLHRRLLDPEPVSGRTQQFGDAPGEPQETTSFSVADGAGNMICITQSLGGKFGTGIVIPGYGVAMNNMLEWGDLNPQSPNCMRAGGPLGNPKAPTIGLREGAPVLALGTPGSYTISQAQTQVIVQHVSYGRRIQAAIEAPRVNALDGLELKVESRVSRQTSADLRRRGHAIEVVEPYSQGMGGMQGVARDPASGALEGGADPRRDGYAIGI